jgi:hypothetical protein
MFRSASSKSPGRAWVRKALPLEAALLAALIGMALLLAIGAQPAAAQEQTGGAVVAWGYNSGSQRTVPSDLAGVTAISAGGVHSMALRDPVPPRVTSVVPVKNATGIRPGTNVSAFFSEAMKADSINTNTFKIFKAGEDRARKATVTYDGATNKAKLDPSADLRRGDSYRVVVTTGARDEAGNRLDQDRDPSNGHQRKQWSFTVRK